MISKSPRNGFIKQSKSLREPIAMAVAVFAGHCTDLPPQKWRVA